MEFIKKIIFIFFFRFNRYLHRKHVVILMFHGVMEPALCDTWKPLREQLSPSLFEKYIKKLSDYYNIIDLDQAVEMILGQCPLLPYSLVITFDDGLRNFYKYVFPVLERHQITAVNYISTYNTEHLVPFWFDRLDYALQLIDDDIKLTVNNNLIILRADNRFVMEGSYKKLRYFIKNQNMSDDEMQCFIHSIAESIEKKHGKELHNLFPSDPWTGIMSWDELRFLSEKGILIGSHTVHHSRLPFLSSEKVDEELVQSKKAIEEHLGRECKHFCYPNGDYNDQVAQQVRAAGYVSAVTTEPGFNAVGDDLMKLRRFHVPYGDDNEDVTALLYKICGLELFVSRLKAFFSFRPPKKTTPSR